MISFDDAQSLIASHSSPRPTEDIPLCDALGRIVAEEICAPIDLPPFDNSAVDGFAVSAACTLNRLPLFSSVKAEKQAVTSLPAGTTVKIMTGAPLPQGADAVAMLEDVRVENDEVHFLKPRSAKENVRFRGEDVERGTRVVSAGCKILPQTIGLLAGLGIKQVSVFRPPSIRIISTGDELVMPGEPLSHGQVYYLMGPMLKAQCALLGIHDVAWEVVNDEVDAIASAFKRASACDIVLFTGGMSKGEYDCVRLALKKCESEEIFYQGLWRPGKPLYFGRRGNTLIFGLPGNPVAAFVCFHVFVRAANFCSMKFDDLGHLKTAIAVNDFDKKPGFTFFARARVCENNRLHFLPGQGSHQIFSLSSANALCMVPSDRAIVKAGEVVQYYPC